MNALPSTVAVLLALSLVTSPLLAAPTPFECPVELPKTEQKLDQVPEGFTVTTSTPYPRHELTGFRVNLGPVDVSDATINDKASNKRDARGGRTETLTWNVAQYEDAYAICLYRATTQALVRPLAGYRECTVISTAAPSGLLKMQSASCR
ncbi:STY0301 family protein [Roseateles chitinivorans]|uniref:STY0301 family protein n=1 Tax=Roseateles chitinivorans TaxID=2917965 RepID=UPI003D67C8E7